MVVAAAALALVLLPMLLAWESALPCALMVAGSGGGVEVAVDEMPVLRAASECCDCAWSVLLLGVLLVSSGELGSWVVAAAAN